MTSRLKEDERNERTIRNLLKLPENRRCINCNSLGPQYVCTNFSTFVCTICSGIHREFTHRVKSVSMAKFTSQEVTALQGGGNAKAKEIYFKEWDPQRQSLPDSSNIERLRDFIRHVYVDRRYTGEKWVEKSPIKRPISNGGSDDRSPKNSNEERRYDDVSSPPIIRPVRDILGEKVSPLKIIEPPKANGQLRTQKSVPSNINQVAEVKIESSLIDFDAVPEPLPPPSTAQPPQIQQPSTSPNTNWATFDSVQEVKTSYTPSSTNLLDALSELSVSTPPQSSLFSTTAPVLAPISSQTPVQSFSQADVISTAKKELPVDLFTSNYSAYGGPGPGWFPTPQYGMGFNMQYDVSAHMPPAYLQPSRPLYPFNVDESSSVQFPSMVPLQGALPNMAFPSGLHRTSSLGTFSQTWMPTQSSTIHRTSSLGTPSPAWMPTQPQLPPHGQFMGQPLPNMPPPPRQQVGGFGSDNTSFKSYNYNQQQSGPSFSSSRGNPFG